MEAFGDSQRELSIVDASGVAKNRSEKVLLLIWGQEVHLLIRFVVETSHIRHLTNALVPTLVYELKELLLVGGKVGGVHEYLPEDINILVLD